MSVNGSILIRDYEVTACHGVNPEEKTDSQRFLVSAVLDLDLTQAAECDDIDKTVSYAAVNYIVTGISYSTCSLVIIYSFLCAISLCNYYSGIISDNLIFCNSVLSTNREIFKK